MLQNETSAFKLNGVLPHAILTSIQTCEFIVVFLFPYSFYQSKHQHPLRHHRQEYHQ